MQVRPHFDFNSNNQKDITLEKGSFHSLEGNLLDKEVKYAFLNKVQQDTVKRISKQKSFSEPNCETKMLKNKKK